MSLERCQVRHVRLGSREVIVPGMGRLWRSAVPEFAQRAYQQLVQTTGLRCRPTLVAVENAQGAGGFYVDGVIAFGLQDVEAMADNMYAYFQPLDDAQAWWYQHHAPHQIITAADRLQAATTALLAHELGHAWAAQHGVSQFGVAEEVQADNIAGQLAGQLRTRPELDHAFFHAIGCTSPVGCTHPSPKARVKAYAQGRAQAEQRQRLSW